jgi:hypothetical protein
MEQKINCAESCIDGCILEDKCPHIEFREAATKFIAETPLEQMLEIAEENLRKRRTESPKWIFPPDSSPEETR